MSLGAQLAAAQAAQEEAARRQAAGKQCELDEARLVAELQVRHFFNFAFSLFEFRLQRGQLPGKVALGARGFRDAAQLLETFRWAIPYQKGAEWRTAGKGIWTPGHACHDLWLEFEARCIVAGLAPKWSACDDGVGVESWYELTVVAS